MAGYFGQQIQEEGDSNFGSPYLRDYRHASKVFKTNGYALIPKFKFLFHVYFDINTTAYSQNLSTGANHGLLVKTVKLPSFTFTTHDLNQYNRKRIVQTKIKYDAVNITFHDDVSNTITGMWEAYYKYYYKDGSNFGSAFNGARGQTLTVTKDGYESMLAPGRNLYTDSDDMSMNNDWGLTGENAAGLSQKPAFFKSITIFGFSQPSHNFTAYTLVNPLITSFGHDTYSYADAAGTMELSMALDYESVVYNEGGMDGRTPDNIVTGFGRNESYDTTLSPITRRDMNGQVFGPTGYMDAVGGFINNAKKIFRGFNI